VKLDAAIVGEEAGPLEHRLDARWIMAYSAALGEINHESVPHPLFPVCYEWPVSQPIRDIPQIRPLASRLVHAQHDLVVHRSPKVNETVRVTVRIARAEQRPPGAFVVYRFSARGADGRPVTTSDFGALYRGVELQGGARGDPVDNPPASCATLRPVGEIPVAATAAHVYTECARIWNPIHTDRAYAQAAGLPDIILHGTATLAYSISALLKRFAIRAPSVKRARCRFGGMVLMPSMLSVHAARDDDGLSFETRNERGEAVIGRGQLLLE
jgi:acyl dehydratase